MLFAMTDPSTLGKEDCVFRLTFKVSKLVHLSFLQPEFQRCFTKSLWMTLGLAC